MHDHSDIPHGYCACGCGEKTKLADRNDPKYGWVKGEPKRFIHGHYGRLSIPDAEGPNPSGLCMCGCGGEVGLATQSRADKGHVRGKPVRWIPGHQHRKSAVDWIEEDRGYGSPCWIWQGAKGANGYGNLRFGNTTKRAHRWVYEQRVGEIPDGLQLDHLCRVPSCVNPDHLEPVTAAENMRRMRLALSGQEQN